MKEGGRVDGGREKKGKEHEVEEETKGEAGWIGGG